MLEEAAGPRPPTAGRGSPLSILLVSDAPAVGGSEVYMRELLPPLRQHGIFGAVALPEVPETWPFREELRSRGIPVHAYRALSELAAAQAQAQLTLLSSWNPGGYQRYYRELRGPFISLLHDQLMLHIPGLPQGIYRACYEYLQARDIRQAGQVITVSHWAAAYLRRYHHLPQVHAVPNGVDEQKFRPAESAERQALRERYDFQRFTVLVPARMSIEKNHPTVLAVARSLPELDFALVGSGYLEPWLRRLASPNVRFLGKRQDMPELYRAADVVFQPTIAENQSLATLEALASGTPVITNDIPAQRELIQFGREGLLIGSGISGYITALRALARHPAQRARMAQAARRRVLEGHSLTQNAECLAQVLWQIAATPSYTPR